jgi:hypothetical protein
MPAAPAAESWNDQLVKSINERVQSGKMKRAIADKSMQQMALKPLTVAPTSPQPAKPLPGPKVANTETPLLPTIIEQTWPLVGKVTLRENLNSWAKAAGWNPVAWDTALRYQVITAMNLRGTLPEVLQKIAGSTGLRICIQNKNIQVADGSVVCPAFVNTTSTPSEQDWQELETLSTAIARQPFELVSRQPIEEQFRKYSIHSGWTLIWDAPEYMLDHSAILPIDFETALTAFLKSANTSGIRLRATFYRGNKTVRVEQF